MFWKILILVMEMETETEMERGRIEWSRKEWTGGLLAFNTYLLPPRNNRAKVSTSQKKKYPSLLSISWTRKTAQGRLGGTSIGLCCLSRFPEPSFVEAAVEVASLPIKSTQLLGS
jgi:hypothetical protein